MQTVWKFPFRVDDEFALDLPVDAKVLHVEAQSGRPCIWALVDPDAITEQRTFYVHGTGHPIPDGRVHLGSFQLFDGAFVGHLFEPVRQAVPA